MFELKYSITVLREGLQLVVDGWQELRAMQVVQIAREHSEIAGGTDMLLDEVNVREDLGDVIGKLAIDVVVAIVDIRNARMR